MNLNLLRVFLKSALRLWFSVRSDFRRKSFQCDRPPAKAWGFRSC